MPGPRAGGASGRQTGGPAWPADRTGHVGV